MKIFSISLISILLACSLSSADEAGPDVVINMIIEQPRRPNSISLIVGARRVSTTQLKEGSTVMKEWPNKSETTTNILQDRDYRYKLDVGLLYQRDIGRRFVGGVQVMLDGSFGAVGGMRF